MQLSRSSGGGAFAVLWAAALTLLCGGLLTSEAAIAVEPSSSSDLIDLHEDNWSLMLKGEWMVEFFAPWCPACKNLAPTWERFATSALKSSVNVAKIDVTTSPSLSGRFFVTALPTIYHVKDGAFRQYRGSRDGDALMFFVKQKQWTKIEPISAWKKPDTIHMSILSYFFKLSHTLKDFNSRLQEEYGLPTWGSYALFAVGTIFVGAALGLMLVCVVDFLYPPKKSQRQSFSESKENSLNSVEDIANDEIEDDAPQNEGSEDEEEADENDDEENEGEDDNENDDDDEDDEEEEDNNEAANGGDDDEASTSDGEKNSKSESEEPESEKKNIKNKSAGGDAQKSEEKQKSPTGGSADLRKRKPRKAD